MSLVDPEYELIDPCPDLHASFLQFNNQFFEGKLITCEVVWSKRMTKCAGLCHFQPRAGYCSIRLSEPLLKLRPRKDFIETLLHEMIHAYLFLTSRIIDRDGHGVDFQFHMHRINNIAGTNITIYHSFHAEVRLYQQHWWRCDGRCRDMRPFYGWVKRAMNRAPSKNDFWWSNHQKICGGNFIKVKEPEKPLKSKSRSKKEVPANDVPKLKNYFPKKGQKLGDGEDNNDKKKPAKTRKSKSPKKSEEERFPGSGHVLGGDPAVKQSRLITDFFPSSNNVKKEPSDSGDAEPKIGDDVIPLIQLDHDEFNWDDEDIMVLDFDDIVALDGMKNGESNSGASKAVKRKSEEDKPGPSKAIKIEVEDDVQIIPGPSETMIVRNNVTEANPEPGMDSLVDCPACTKQFTLLEINDHLDVCVS